MINEKNYTHTHEKECTQLNNFFENLGIINYMFTL